MRAPRSADAFSVNKTTTAQYFSIDAAGNVEAVKSQLIPFDTTAPTTTIACNGAACASSTYPAPVTVTLTATDNAGGSGISSTHYTTDGANPTLTSPIYTGPFTVAGKTTVRYASWDIAGNAEGVKSRAITVADDPPVARLAVTPTSGVFPLSVTADASASTDIDGTPISTYQFNFGDGTTALPVQTQASATHTYTKAGRFVVTVTLKDTANLSSKATVQVIVSN